MNMPEDTLEERVFHTLNASCLLLLWQSMHDFPAAYKKGQVDFLTYVENNINDDSSKLDEPIDIETYMKRVKGDETRRVLENMGFVSKANNLGLEDQGFFDIYQRPDDEGAETAIRTFEDESMIAGDKVKSDLALAESEAQRAIDAVAPIFASRIVPRLENLLALAKSAWSQAK